MDHQWRIWTHIDGVVCTEADCDKLQLVEQIVEEHIHIDLDMSHRYTVKSMSCWKRGLTHIEVNYVAAFDLVENSDEPVIERF